MRNGRSVRMLLSGGQLKFWYSLLTGRLYLSSSPTSLLVGFLSPTVKTNYYISPLILIYMSDKLVRDNIPDAIRENGEIPKTHAADDEEYMERLCDKLVEEAEKYRENQDVEKLADLMEVILSIRSLNHISRKQVERKRRRKREEKGGFEDRIVLDKVHAECEYCSTVSSDVDDREILDDTFVELCSDCFIKYRTELRNSRMHL